MLKLYVFWGGLALVMLGVVYTLVENRRQSRRARRAYVPPPVPRQAQAEPVIAGASDPESAAPESAEFDPTATRIYMRPAASGAGNGQAAVSLAGHPRLVCLGGPHSGHAFDIPGIGLSIGRAEDNDVVIIDGRVSAHHAWIGIVEGRAVLRDYQSLNGTFLNSRMDVSVAEANLANGDTLVFGGKGGDPFRFVVE